jgi:hypothetical protein
MKMIIGCSMIKHVATDNKQQFSFKHPKSESESVKYHFYQSHFIFFHIVD